MTNERTKKINIQNTRVQVGVGCYSPAA